MIPLPLFPSHPTCTACALSTCTLPRGHNGLATTIFGCIPDPLKPPLVIIGMNPGREECLRNEPFVGPSGRIVRNVFIPFARLDSLSTVYITNAARCYSPVLPTGNTITPKHYRTCIPLHLLPDLRKIADFHRPLPLSLLLLGAETTKHVSAALRADANGFPGATLIPPLFPRLSDAFKDQGREIRWNATRVRFFATFHPAAILRDRKLLLSTQDHLSLLAASLSGRTSSPSAPRRIAPRFLS